MKSIVVSSSVALSDTRPRPELRKLVLNRATISNLLDPRGTRGMRPETTDGPASAQTRITAHCC